MNGTVNDIAYRSNKLETVSVIAFGWPDEEKELPRQWRIMTDGKVYRPVILERNLI